MQEHKRIATPRIEVIIGALEFAAKQDASTAAPRSGASVGLHDRVLGDDLKPIAVCTADLSVLDRIRVPDVPD